MKAKMLKLAGVKSEAEFYKKFPDEESFMKVHGKEFKKALRGSKIQKAQVGQYITSGGPSMYKPVDIRGMYDDIDYTLTGMPTSEKNRLKALGEVLSSAKSKDGKKLNKAQFGTSTGPQLTPGQGFQPTSFGTLSTTSPTYNWAMGGDPLTEILGQGLGSQTSMAGGAKKKFDPMKALPIVGNVIQGISNIKAAKEAYKQAKQSNLLTGVMSEAVASGVSQIPRRQYLRPEDVVFNPEEMYPTYGTGTPAVHAQDGAMIGGNPTEIQNMYNPGTIYSDMGYEPLGESDQVKQFQGGGIMNAINSFGNTGVGQFLNTDVGRGIADVAGGGRTGGWSNILGSVPGPTGTLLRFVGSAIDRQLEKKIENQQKLAQKNMSNIVGQQVGMNMRNQFSGSFEDGGQVSDYQWVSHTWQPQVITHFGEHRVSDLLKPPADADMLRAGGHLKSYTAPSEKAMQTFAMGGDLQIDGRGDIEFMGYNPVTASTGASGYIGISRGPSHDDGGFNIDYSGNEVEIEGGETVMERKDGGPVGDKSLNILGNLKMGIFADSILDDVNKSTVSKLLKGRKLKDVKFKHLGNDIAKKTKQLNKMSEKYADLADSANTNSPFDKLQLSTANAAIKGINMQYKDLNNLQDNMTGLQGAYNDTAEEYGLIADDLAIGKIQKDKEAEKEMAKHGKMIEKAQDGKYMGVKNSILRGLYDLLEQKGYNIRTSSGYRPGDPKRHGSHGAIDIQFPDFGASSYQKILEDPEVVDYMVKNGITALNEYDKDVVNRINANRKKGGTKSTGNHIHFGFDRGTDISEQFRKDAAAKYPNLASVAPKETPMQPYKEQVSRTTTPTAPTTSTELPKVSRENYNYLKGLYEAAQKQGRGDAVLKFQKEFHRLAPDYAKSVIGRYPTTTFGKQKGYKNIDLRSNEDEIFGERTVQYMAALDDSMKQQRGGLPSAIRPIPPIKPLVPKPPSIPQVTTPAAEVKKGFDWMTAFNQVLPYLRPSDIEQLDPMQLAGEMYAMSQNVVEPVWAQKLTPRLTTPYDISLQDILNENRAALRRQQGIMGYNPAAQAALAAGEYQANQRVLGEQFRLNQAERNRIYEQNRNILNQYDMANLEILDRQYGRQAEALSKTKATTQAALNSMASKIAQNKLENRMLATYENLYNYRYDPRFRAINMNPLAQFDVSVEDGAQAPPLATPGITAKKGKKIKKDSRNSNIVKAIKNL